jgi:hypothetical protein
VLSPGEGGGKESVQKILGDFANRHDLAAVDLWDYDKLRVLLDNFGEVRRSYMAWITTSDVLAELCAWLKRRERDYYPLVLRYLQRELIADQYAQLEQAGHSADEKIPLSQVFIDLATTLRPPSSEIPEQHDQENPRFVATIVKDANHSYRRQGTDSTEPQDRLKTAGRYVLIGGPGQGKTTVGQYVCQVFRCALLNDVPPHLLSIDALTALQGFAEKWKLSSPNALKARRLPFRIVLGDLAKSLAAGDTKSLIGYLAARFTANTETTFLSEEIERILTEYPSVIVLDGLDEVPSSTNREAVMTAVSNFAIDVATGNLDVMIIATSRPQGYNEDFSARQYTHHYLTPLTPDDALAYGDRLAETRFGTNTDRSTKVQHRIRRAIANPATARLMHSPLQVTILTLLVDRIGTPPEERWALFNAYYRLIFERETERDIPSVTVLRTHTVDIDAIHRRVGLALQVESERSGGTDARLTVDQFGKIVEDYLIEEGNEHPGLEVLKGKIIEAATNRLVFLVGLEAGQVGFEIRSLQEFMAAEGLMEGPDEVIRDRLTEVAVSSHWRNAFLFAAGKCFAERRYLRDTIEAICFELNEDADESLRKLLVGSELALDLLEDGPARKQPAKRRSLTRLAVQLLEKPFHDVARLAAVCEDDTCDIYLDKLQSELLHQSELEASAAWICLGLLTEVRGGVFEGIMREILASNRMSKEVFEVTVELATGRNQYVSDTLLEFVKKNAPPLRGAELALWYSDDQEELAAFGPWRLSDSDDWLKWYAYVSSRRGLGWSGNSKIRVGNSKQPGYILRFNSVDPQLVDKTFIPPNDIPDESTWDFIRRAGEFCAQPCAQTLAKAVRAYVERVDRGAGPVLTNWYPWPLAECALACHQGQAGMGLILDALDRGGFGDLDSWLMSEKQFADGISLDYLTQLQPVVATEGHGTALYQFPFRARLTLPARGSEVDTLEADLVEAFDRTSSHVVRNFLARLLFTRSIGDIEARRPREWLDRVLLSLTHPGVLNYRFYEWLPQLDFRDPAWSETFAASHLTVFRRPFPSSRRFSAESLRLLWSIAASVQEQKGLFVPFAVAMGSFGGEIVSSIVHYLTVPEEASPSMRVAALLINIASGVSVSELANEIVWALGADRRLFISIAGAVTLRELSQNDECRELLDLIALSEASSDETWSVLRTNFLRRQSRLAKMDTWAALRLPSGMLPVLDW